MNSWLLAALAFLIRIMCDKFFKGNLLICFWPQRNVIKLQCLDLLKRPLQSDLKVYRNRWKHFQNIWSTELYLTIICWERWWQASSPLSPWLPWSILQYHGNADVDLSRECSSCKKNWAWVGFLGINAKNDLFCVIRRIQARVIVSRFSQNNWS